MCYLSSFHNLIYSRSHFCFYTVLLHSTLACLAMPMINITTDQNALLALKSHFNFGPYHMLVYNWTVATPVCDWIGVTCGSQHHRVTVLNISNMGLTGIIPPHLGNLSFLVSLDVSNNSFHGDLPKELTYLRRLKGLNLSFNFFTGSLPSWFSVLSNLEKLVLRNNNFTGSIPPSISNITKLESLELRYNSLQGMIPKAIGNLGSLKSLSVRYNQLKGPVPFTLFNISSLQILDLTANSLSGDVPMDLCYRLPKLKAFSLSINEFEGQFPSSLINCSELQYLSLKINKFKGAVPRGIGNLTFMKEIYLGRNNLTGEIPQEIGNLHNLEALDMNDNNFRGHIPSVIFNITKLRYVALSRNIFSRGKLPSGMGRNMFNLEELYIAENNLTGPFPDFVLNASKLTVLSIAANEFTGPIPDFLGNLKFLERLYVNQNNFTSKPSSKMSFLTSLTNCRNLRDLSIGGNPINDILPASVGNLSTSLQIFGAYACKIKGNIPNEIGNLSSLRLLSLFGNDLAGTIPPSIGNLQKLERLDFTVNKLRGSIPNDLCSLQKLGLLYLGLNQISGSVPSCLWNITSLRHLRLDSNKLTSNIPSALGGLQNLMELDLSSNSLSGSLPQEIGTLKACIIVDVSVNGFSGNIPSTVGDLQNLIYLYLENNRLNGPIPQSFGKLVSLEFLDLSQNELSGTIPKPLEALLYLKYFNVSFNKLIGEIPSRGVFANFNSQSFISNEALCGSPRFKVQSCHANIIHHPMAKKLVLLIALLAIALAIMLMATLAFLLSRYRNKKAIPAQRDSLCIIEHERLSFHQLQQATNGFSESNFLGMGSFCTVYKGVLRNGKELAVKVFNLQQEGAFKSFDVECEALRQLRHRNLTKVISSCSNLDFKALVLEYMSNGSLEKWLYSHNYFLDILQRVDIMIDVACALDYLHHGYPTPVIHCDVKPSNILLDEHMVGHVSDFGVAKLLGKGENIAQTTTLATLGYMAPEYGQEGLVSTMCDVYSYGILLMETFTRKKPTDDRFSEDFTFKRWVKDSLCDGEASIVDANLLKPDDDHVVERVQFAFSIMELALNCCADSPGERMNMNDVLAALKEIRIQFTGKV